MNNYNEYFKRAFALLLFSRFSLPRLTQSVEHSAGSWTWASDTGERTQEKVKTRPTDKNCIDDHFGRNQRRMERMLRGGSLGRNLIRNLGEGFNDQLERPPCVTEVQEEADGKYTGSNEDGSRVSLRLQSLNYLKKFSSWKIPQGSLSRVLSFKQNRQFSFPNYKSYVRPIQSPTSSEYGSIVSSFSYRASSPPEFGRPSTPSSVVESDAVTRNFIPKRKRKHRRAKSIGDIAVSPV